jgi:hypothetical protein
MLHTNTYCTTVVCTAPCPSERPCVCIALDMAAVNSGRVYDRASVITPFFHDTKIDTVSMDEIIATLKINSNGQSILPAVLNYSRTAPGAMSTIPNPEGVVI